MRQLQTPKTVQRHLATASKAVIKALRGGLTDKVHGMAELTSSIPASSFEYDGNNTPEVRRFQCLSDEIFARQNHLRLIESFAVQPSKGSPRQTSKLAILCFSI